LVKIFLAVLRAGSLMGAQQPTLSRHVADIAVCTVRPVQTSLIAKKLGEVATVVAAHQSYLARAGTPRAPKDLLRDRLIG
jgi:DNA-binding transcriptional LysR family regulator